MSVPPVRRYATAPVETDNGTGEPAEVVAERMALLEARTNGTAADDEVEQVEPWGQGTEIANGHRQPDQPDGPVGPEPIDWPVFWSQDTPGPEWMVEPVIPLGRAVVIYGNHKVGKSLLALDMAAAVATGRSALGNAVKPAVRVLYLDMEMGEDDLRERLESLGYGPEVDMSNLRYFSLPSLPPLDTPEGGAALAALVAHHEARFVVIDTMGRAVNGDENSADTYRGFWRHTGQRLKAAGVTVTRLDHAGKNADAGQRGSSAKGDDVDVIWKLSAADGNTFVLKRDDSRVPWVPLSIGITREEEPVLRHVAAAQPWPAGTAETAARLQLLDVAPEASARVAQAALRTAGEGRRMQVVNAAQRYRRTAFPSPTDPS